jgi:AcrR family transcriptional regulator
MFGGMQELALTDATTPADTRDMLVLAAERLFAERGIDAVSLREINLAAGQRNKSAVHYHFGGKPELVEAIFARGTKAVDAARHERMDALESRNEPPKLRDLVAILVQPLAEQIDGGPGGSHFVRFLGRIEGDPAWTLLRFRGKFGDDGVQRVFAKIFELLDSLPRTILTQRLRDAISFYVRSLGDREHRIVLGKSSGRELPLAVFVSSLIDSISGMLAAPVSNETLAGLECSSTDQQK